MHSARPGYSTEDLVVPPCLARLTDDEAGTATEIGTCRRCLGVRDDDRTIETIIAPHARMTEMSHRHIPACRRLRVLIPEVDHLLDSGSAFLDSLESRPRPIGASNPMRCRVAVTSVCSAIEAMSRSCRVRTSSLAHGSCNGPSTARMSLIARLWRCLRRRQGLPRHPIRGH